jgi:MPBQ/MSBQ methyltransferase
MNALAEWTHAGQSAATLDSFQRYYEEAGPDYAAWSSAFNVHFGFFRRGLNPLDREAMLEQMNLEVFNRLNLGHLNRPRILDMGCGLGTTLRSFARRHPFADLCGITLVPWQFEQGTRLNQMRPECKSITLVCGNYEATEQPSASVDGICAIESSCYSAGAAKTGFLCEAHRLLRPGGRLVVADGFLAHSRLHGLQKVIYRQACNCWVIDVFGEIGPFTAELTRLGFHDIVVERVQAPVAPSVLHVPWVTLHFLVSVVSGRKKMTRARWNNVLAPLLLPFISCPFGPLAYYIISATRGE